jgi:hypothetical protein
VLATSFFKLEDSPFGVFGVGDGITDNVLEEDLQDATGLFVDETRDTLNTATASKPTDSLVTSGSCGEEKVKEVGLAGLVMP